MKIVQIIFIAAVLLAPVKPVQSVVTPSISHMEHRKAVNEGSSITSRNGKIRSQADDDEFKAEMLTFSRGTNEDPVSCEACLQKSDTSCLKGCKRENNLLDKGTVIECAKKCEVNNLKTIFENEPQLQCMSACLEKKSR